MFTTLLFWVTSMCLRTLLLWLGLFLNNRSLSFQETAVNKACMQEKWSVLCEAEVVRDEHGPAYLGNDSQ